jgi:flagellin
MSLSILNNVAALYAQNNLGTTQSNLQNTLEQLSSGSRINSGADDPSGLAVSDGLTANQAALTQSSRNATNAIGYLQTADGALSQVTSLLDQAVTLATQASNGTLTDAQVSSANQEYQNILTQIGDIGTATHFNSLQVFTNTAKTMVVSDGTTLGTNQYAETVGQLSTQHIGTGVASSVPATVTPVNIASNLQSTFTFGSANDTVGGTSTLTLGGGAVINFSLTAGSTIAQAVTQMQGEAGANATVQQGDGITHPTSSIVITTTGTDTQAYSANAITDTAAANAVGTGQDLASAGALTASNAQQTLQNITTAINDVAYQRGTLGGEINQLSSAAAVASAEQVNLASAQNSVTATDYGQAASNLSKYQILSQTGISALAQANSVQQEVLKLLQ